MNPYSTVRQYLRKMATRPSSQTSAVGSNNAPVDAEDERQTPSLSRLLNSVTLILGRVAQMGLGFLFWLLAARLFAPAEVGLASGAISAMMLCVQLALLGVGSAFITLFPQHQHRPAYLLDTAFNIIIVASLLTAGLFLAFASGIFQELSVVGTIPIYILLFLALNVLGTVGVLFDYISIALRRGDQVLVRNVLFGVVSLACIASLPWMVGAASSLVIFSSWVIGGLSAYLFGFVQLARSLSQYRYRPRLEPRLARQLFSVGLPNYALTLTERVPGSIMPIVVTELLSPNANAYWYPVWMMAWAVFIIPISVGQTLFAAATHQSGLLRDEIRHSIRSSLTLGVIAATGAAVVAPFVLSLMGQGYAAAGTTPLRILVIGALPFTFIQAYFAACRATQRLREATLTGTVSGAVAVTGAAVAGIAYGLTGMAIAWVAAQLMTGIWAAWRLRTISKRD